MLSPVGANLLPPPPPKVTVAIFAVVADVGAAVVIVVIFGEVGAPLEMIEGLPHLVLVPVRIYLPKHPDLISLMAALCG